MTVANCARPGRRAGVAIALCAAALGGCYSVDVAGFSSFNNCPQSAVLTGGQGISDFKQRIARQSQLAPGDSGIDVRLTYKTAVTTADRDRIAQYGGTSVLAGATDGVVTARFPMSDLARFVAEDGGRLSDAVIFVSACVSD